jgi:hypothetical protein
MIAVTLDGVAPDDWYDDNMVLLDYAFEEKAEREELGQPFAGDIVAFRDPSAALVGRFSVAGGSGTGQTIVAQALPSPTSQPNEQTPLSAEPSPTLPAGIASISDSNTSDSGSSGLRIIAVAAVALLVIGVRLVDSWRRSPMGAPWSLTPSAALASPEVVADVLDRTESIDAEASKQEDE